MRKISVPMARALKVMSAVLLLSLAACSSLKDDNAPPAGLTCTKTVNGGGDSQTLASALAGAPLGSCVVVVSQTYTGNFVVPAGVTLVSAQGSRAKVTSTDPSAPAITLQGGLDSAIQGLDVTAAADVGIAVRGGPARLSDVGVSGAKSAAVAALCSDDTCHDGAHGLTLDDVHLVGNDTGLWTSGEDVTMIGGEASRNTSSSLTGGNGVVALAGAHVTLDGTAVSNNDQIGILFDGKGGTTGDLKSVIVDANGGRGVWAQGLNGTIDTPALTIEGASALTNNKIVGLGAVGSHGIIFVGGKIQNSVAAPIVTDLGSTEQVGDGFGFFGQTGDVKLDTVDVSGNSRAAGLIDNPTNVIIFVGGKVDPGASGLKIVVQNLDAQATAPQIASDVTSTSSELGFSAPSVSVGAFLR